MTREPDAATLIGAVRAGATHAFFAPPVIARFIDAGEAARATISGLGYIVYGAAPMPAVAAAGARDLAGDEFRPGVRTNGAVRRGHRAE
jgi:hypothetical protein